LSFGFDPELFVVRKGSRYASSVHLMGVTDNFDSVKANDDGRADMDLRDRHLSEPSGYGKIFMKTDGFAVELNANHPGACRDFFIPYTAAVLREFYRQYGESWRLSAVPVMQLTRESVSGDVPHGVNEFGCLPDIDAYSLTEKTPFRDSYHNNVRYTGGHIHVGYNQQRYVDGKGYMSLSDEEKLINSGRIAIMLDLALGIPLVAMLGNSNDYGEATRRTYYGQAGSYRVKDYGMEYRVPSSAIMMSPILMAWVFGVVKRRRFISNTKQGNIDTVKRMHDTYDFDRMRHIINSHDVNEARKFVYEHREGVLEYRPSFYDVMVDADIGGLPLNTNMFEAWQLDQPILNHGYMGVERLLGGYEFAKTVFPVRVKPEFQTTGWNVG
jgi:hypothetical protein